MHPGARIGHYEMLAVIGRGGMGEVWKALDTRLGREVAMKTLPPELVADAARIARLGREATMLATLNHPNIAAIYGLEEYDDQRFLVLELVDGLTLNERLSGGRLAVDQALEIALQMADALESAHNKGIIHRDLKPANVKVTSNRRVKVLDFGIAKSLEPVLSGLPTATSLDTAAGAIMGTPWYMSPEQARAEEAGRQTDIWSFGVVLYQMLTGKLPFPGNTATEALARVLETPPDLLVLPSDLPHGVKRVLRRCLEKDPRRRIQHAGDLRIEIEDALAEREAPSVPGAAASRRRGLWPLAAALAIGAVIAGGLTAWSLTGRGTAPAPAGPIRVSLPFDGGPSGWPMGSRHVAIAGDGSRIAYVSDGALQVRALRSTEPVSFELRGSNPFFSPDGAWVGFFGVAALMKVPAAAGQPVQLFRSAERPAGAAWGTNGSIVFATTAGLFRVSEDGGEAEVIAQPRPERGERLYAWPELLPAEQAVLLTVFSENLEAPPQIVRLDLGTGESRTVLTGGSAARYAPTGHLVYAVGQELRAVRFDPSSGETRGPSIALSDVVIATTSDNGAAEFALAANGTLVSIAPRPATAARAAGLVWIDRSGAQTPLGLEPGSYFYPRVSPDGARVALDVGGSANRDIWIWDLRRSSLTRLTSSPTEDALPMWSKDSRRIFFTSNRGGTFDVYSQAADGASEARVEVAAPGFQAPNSFTPDGTQLIVYENFHDISVLDLRTATLQPLLHSSVEHRISEISPDGRWLAYESNESGTAFEIFLRPFPDVNARREQVSIDGGRYPVWGPPGSNELYYVSSKGEMMSVAVELTPELQLGAVTKLFDWQPPPPQVSGRPYDVSPIDGRFLMAAPALRDNDALTQVSIVLNWFDELRTRVP